jgi:ABC-2 type transport system permease protein
MRPRNILVLVKREYSTRIKTRGFWISTVALPLILVMILVLPALLFARSTANQKLVVVDETGQVAPFLAPKLEEQREVEKEIVFFDILVEEPAEDTEAQRGMLDGRVLDEAIDAWVWISHERLADGRVEYHAKSVSNVLTQQVLARAISSVVRSARLQEAGYDEAQIADLTRSVRLSTVRISEAGSQAESGQAVFALASMLAFLLYLMLTIYGAQVMHGVLEEKSSRVVELIVSTVRPFELMVGKLIGIGLVGFTQLALWLGTFLLLTTPLGVGATSLLPHIFDVPSFGPRLAIHFAVLFLLGFFLYASFYAAIGAASNSIQEAQQFAFMGILLLLISFTFFFPVINDPDSTVAVVFSLIPAFTPVLMMLRVVVKMPPLWQVVLAYALTTSFILFMMWVCGRIYRTGILMHGKKPTVRELWRWVRYA